MIERRAEAPEFVQLPTIQQVCDKYGLELIKGERCSFVEFKNGDRGFYTMAEAIGWHGSGTYVKMIDRINRRGRRSHVKMIDRINKTLPTYEARNFAGEKVKTHHLDIALQHALGNCTATLFAYWIDDGNAYGVYRRLDDLSDVSALKSVFGDDFPHADLGEVEAGGQNV